MNRLTEIKYPAITYVDSNNSLPDTNQFTDMFSYTQAGQVAGKQIQVSKTHTYLQSNQQHTQTAVGNLNVAYAYNSEGKLTNVTYPTDINNNAPTFAYAYDQMMRLSSMTDSETNSASRSSTASSATPPIK